MNYAIIKFAGLQFTGLGLLFLAAVSGFSNAASAATQSCGSATHPQSIYVNTSTDQCSVAAKWDYGNNYPEVNAEIRPEGNFFDLDVPPGFVISSLSCPGADYTEIYTQNMTFGPRGSAVSAEVYEGHTVLNSGSCNFSATVTGNGKEYLITGTANRSSNIELQNFQLEVISTGTDTADVIASFMLNRANGIVGNQPDLTGLLDGNFASGGGPLGYLGISGNEQSMNLAFSTSLSKIDRERARIMAGQAAGRIDDAHGWPFPPSASNSPGGPLPKIWGGSQSSVAPAGTYGAALVGDTDGMGDASAAYSMPARRFDVWTQIQGSRSTAGDAENSLWIGYVGAHWFVNPDMIIGGLVQFDWAQQEDDGQNSSIEGHGWLVGPYIAGRVPGTSLSYEARAAWGRSANSVSPAGTYEDDFDTERWLASGKIEGSFQVDAAMVTPYARISYFEETQETYTDSLSATIPEQTISLGEMRFGSEFSQTLQLDNGSTLTPSLGIAGVWNFDISDGNASRTYSLGDGDLRARLDAGFSLTNAMGWAFSASGYYDGLGVDDYSAMGGKIRLTIPLP